MVLPASAAATLMTVEEFINLPLPDRKAELVRGELRVSPPAGGPHGVAATNLVSLLAAHAKATGVHAHLPTESDTNSYSFRIPFGYPTSRSFAAIASLPEELAQDF